MAVFRDYYVQNYEKYVYFKQIKLIYRDIESQKKTAFSL